jgi:ABC-type polar amino acid transport system ATPase subunit
MLRQEADAGVAVLLSAHEVELTAQVADQVHTLRPVTIAS